MNILVFGSTGSIGTQLLQQGLANGHSITAFARDITKISVTHENLKTVQGDVLDPASVAAAIGHDTARYDSMGYDAVIIVLGAGMKGGVRAKGTLNIIQAMQQKNIKRLVCQSTLGAGDSRGNLNFFWKYIMFGGLLKQAYADHQQQEQIVRASGLDWTIVRPAAFTDGRSTGKYRHGFATDDKTTQLKISRADVAEFLLRQLSDSRYLYQSPGLSY